MMDGQVFSTTWQKHIGTYLDKIQTFNCHIKEKIPKTMKGVSIIKNRSKTITWHFLVIIYKPFVKPRLDYDDITYNQPNNESFA